MTTLEWLQESMIKLRNAGVDSPRRDCLVLLEDTLQKDRAWVLANPHHTLPEQSIKKLEKLIQRRIAREPLAYIRGKAWFWGRFFKVTTDVMIPRPESENFIELLKEIKPKRVLDIGTGSGCLAITTKLELPGTEVIATDISQRAISLARQNATMHKVDVDFHKGSLLSPLSTIYDLQSTILANLPYVPEGMVTSPEIKHEPKQALFSGEDGLGHYREFWRQVQESGKKPEYILTESLKNQHKKMSGLAKRARYKPARTDVLVQLFRHT